METIHSDIPDALTEQVGNALDVIELLADTGFLQSAEIRARGQHLWWAANAEQRAGSTHWLGWVAQPDPEESPPWDMIVSFKLASPAPAALLVHILAQLMSWDVTLDQLIVKSGFARRPVHNQPLEVAATYVRGR